MNSTIEKNGQLSELVYLPISHIKQNPQQPRYGTDNKKMVALAESIRIYGVLEPVLVCQNSGIFTIIAGHRRLAAAIIANLEEIPARILSNAFIDYLGVALSENMLRADLNALEVAMALNELSDGGADRITLCTISGLSSPSVSELLRLRVIPKDVCMECIVNGDTTKRFLIQLSLYNTETKIQAAYQFFLKHKQLPPRQKRSYVAGKQMKKPLELLTLLNKSLTETGDIDYTADSVTDDMFRQGISFLFDNLKNHGWFIPQEFDASNPCGI